MIDFKLLNIAKHTSDYHWNYVNITSPFARIYLVTDGEADIYQSRQHLKLTAGNIYLIPAFTTNTYHCAESFAHYYVHVLIEPQGNLSLFGKNLKVFEVKASPFDYSLFERLLSLHPNKGLWNPDPATYNDCLVKNKEGNLLSDYQCKIETFGILSQIVSRFIHPEKIESGQQLPPVRFRSLLQYINTNFTKSFTVAELAEKIYLSPDYFSRLFIKYMHLSPLDYIHQKRIEKAQLLLITTALSSKEIATQSGYENISYFYRQFRKYTSMSPHEFRLVHRNI